MQLPHRRKPAKPAKAGIVRHHLEQTVPEVPTRHNIDFLRAAGKISIAEVLPKFEGMKPAKIVSVGEHEAREYTAGALVKVFGEGTYIVGAFVMYKDSETGVTKGAAYLFRT